MKLADEIFELYRDKITGEDEDIDALALTILREMTREHLLKIVAEMDEEELYELMGQYLIDSLRERFAEEGYGQQQAPSTPNVH